MGTGASQDIKSPREPINQVNSPDKRQHPEMAGAPEQDDLGPIKTFPKRPLVKGGRRPSDMIKTVLMREAIEEQELEDKVVKANPDMKAVFKGFQECKSYLDDVKNYDDQTDTHFSKLLVLLTDKVTAMFDKHSKDDERVVMGNKLADIKFVESLVKYYTFVMDENGLEAITLGFVDEANSRNDPGDHVILKTREILWNFSDNSPNFSESITNTDMLAKLVKDLNCIIEDDGLQMIEVEQDRFAFSSAVGILHNCARSPNIKKEKIRSLGTVDVLCEFLHAKDVYVKTITLLALGNMIKEEEVDKMHADVDVLDFLLVAIKQASNSSDRKWNGFHLSELVDGLAALAQSDKNKREIMLKGPLPLITDIMKSKKNSEVLAAIKLAWELAFLAENKTTINQDAKFMTELKKRTNDKEKPINNAATGASFVIEGMSNRTKQAPPPSTPVSGGATQASRPPGKHIMFSYSWSDKEMVTKIYKILLQEGHTIWIDFQEMGKYANLLEGMAQAVENAHTILVCFSEKYKESQNCRTEADYAFTLKKNIIALKMQRDYAADGWLGAFIGARLYIEFSGKYLFDVKMNELRKQLGSSKIPPPISYPQPELAAPISEPTETQAPVNTQSKILTEWEKKDVEHWAMENQMCSGSFRTVRQLTGKQLRFLCGVSKKAPETFYRWCEDKLKLKSLQDLMLFSDAVDTL